MLTAEALAYVILWASAAIATKFGLRSAPPLILASLRFTIAGLALMGGRCFLRQPLIPPRAWWTTLVFLGGMNTTVYLGASFLALSVVPAGLFNLFVSVNPLMVLIMEQVILALPVSRVQALGLSVATGGLVVGAWQAIVHFRTPLWGIGLLLLGQAAMAAGSVLFNTSKINLSPAVINTWQLAAGAALLWPIALVTEGAEPVQWNGFLWGSLLWLAGAVSIGAMLLWFHLLKRGGTRRASFWLLLTPIMGYGLGFVLLGESITLADLFATALVIVGIVMGQWSSNAGQPPHATTTPLRQ
ncbi:DMT family transporter [Sulfobacillus harzensis]|uniref:DMT family transporter n=1 Tax=Sulfobacillus harzensis TaxID=2729629 RepID=UPI001FAD8D40|nr:DMT family transporter [Sulfobacillus harzensis]